MPLTREVAEECAKEGLLEVLQKGKAVDPPYRGPIRLRLLVKADDGGKVEGDGVGCEKKRKAEPQRNNLQNNQQRTR